MELFISWSGDLSKKIGEIIQNWIPLVIQSVKPYYTPKDIEKGSKWENEISLKLKECKIGLIILTSENSNSPWILFESGALSNNLDKSKVCPILFDLENTDLTGPLATFQTTKFEKQEIKQLMLNINENCGNNRVNIQVLEKTFETFWPQLEESVNSEIENFHANKIQGKKHPELRRTDRQILEEILQLTRSAVIRNNEIYKRSEISESFESSEMKKEILSKLIMEYLIKEKFRLKEIQLLDAEDICSIIEKDPTARKLAGSRTGLLNLINSILPLNL